jgi:predicted nucleic acid-binding protein
MILLDTSVMVYCLAGGKHLAPALRNALADGERIAIPALVLYEWLGGPRLKEELVAQEALFPADLCLSFGAAEAAIGARLFRSLRRPRGREVDIAIAACAISYEAPLWTSNATDFADIPQLQLYHPAPRAHSDS